MVRRVNCKISQPEERTCSVVWWYNSGYFSIACQMAAGQTGCCWGGYCLLASFGLCAGTSPDCSLRLSRWVPMMGSFNHPLQISPVLSRAQTMPICNVSSQDAFYFSSVKVNKNLVRILPSEVSLRNTVFSGLCLPKVRCVMSLTGSLWCWLLGT